MPAWLIRTDNPSAYDAYEQKILVEVIGSDSILEIVSDADPVQGGDTRIGGWTQAQLQVVTPDLAEYEAIRPLGNYHNGKATRDLLYHHIAGWKQPRQLGTPNVHGVAPIYPESNDPFDLEIRHKKFSGSEHGWRAEMIGSAASRDPSVRAMAWYADPECTQYLGTTGAFAQGPSDWQVDSEGEPITVWFAESPPGHRKPAREDWHIALLYASVQEGHETLSVAEESERFLFWENNQPAPPGGAEWVDTGAVVTAPGGGGLYYISSAAVAASLVPNQALRLGPTEETTFLQVWPGTDDLIQIDPHVDVANGVKVWKWA